MGINRLYASSWKKVKYENYVFFIILFLLLFLWSKYVIAGGNNEITTGSFITQADEAWNQLPFMPQLPDEPSYAEILTLDMPDANAMYYIDKDWQASLLIYEQGQQKMLLKLKTPYPSGQMPDPVLISGLFNENKILDILFCHSDDQGIGRAAENWEQNLYLFFDSQETTNNSIPLSSVHRGIGIWPEDCGEPDACEENLRESLLLILPAWGVKLTKSALEGIQQEGVPEHIEEQLHTLKEQIFADEDDFFAAVEVLIGEASTQAYRTLLVEYIEPEPCAIAVWSRLERSEEISYQISQYQVKGRQILTLENIDGDYDEASEILSIMIQERREQEEAPEPILLNLLKDASDYLCDEDEWFQFLVGRK